MADKIDQLKFGNTSYDIDLPPDATPSIDSLTANTVYTNFINAGTGNLTLEYGTAPSGQANRGVIFKESLSDYGVKLYTPTLTSDISIILPSADGTLATQGWVTSQGYTTNTGTVIGSSLTANYFVVGNGTVNVKISSMQPATSSTTWSTSSDVYVPTMKAISSYVTGLGYTSNTGTVTSVRVQAGTGLSSSQSTAQTSTLNTTISIASGYKLPTTTEWNDKSGKLHHHILNLRINYQVFAYAFDSTSNSSTTLATLASKLNLNPSIVLASAYNTGDMIHIQSAAYQKGATAASIQIGDWYTKNGSNYMVRSSAAGLTITIDSESITDV